MALHSVRTPAGICGSATVALLAFAAVDVEPPFVLRPPPRRRRAPLLNVTDFSEMIPSLGNTSFDREGLLSEERLGYLSCIGLPKWAAFRLQLLEALQARGIGQLGVNDALGNAAESLLQPYDVHPREYFQERVQEFHGQVTGAFDAPASDDFCFPGYQAACLVRIVRTREFLKTTSDWPDTIEANAQYCASLFGMDASLDFLSSTGWPVSVLDFEIHMRDCPDASFTSRLAQDLPGGVERYLDFLPHVVQPGVSARLAAGSVDPQGVTRALHLGPREEPRSVVLASVDGGHCALWLEPAFSLRALFPGRVATRLVSYKSLDSCSKQLGEAVFAGEDIYENSRYFDGNMALRSADVIACQWIAECSKLRVAYAKPVIAYIGFLLLNDPSVGNYHAWSEPVAHFWERWDMLLACDVHGGGRGRDRRGALGRPPADGGPPCAVVWEEPQLAEASYWQTGSRLPSVRPLSLYVGAHHDPRAAAPSILIINRGRLARDVMFTQAVNALRHRDYPYDFVDQRAGMAYSEMATHRGVVLQPWDLNLVMFHDLYAMDLPLFLPDRAGLHHTAFAYYSRFRKNMGHKSNEKQPWDEVKPGRTPSPHAYSPFMLEYFEPREYWLGFTEYIRAPHVQRFASVPDLLLQVLRLQGHRLAAAMARHNARCRRQARRFWLGVLTAFENGAMPRRFPRPHAVVHFTTQYGRNLCWRPVMSREDCCDTAHGPMGRSACFDDFWNYQRCCVPTLPLPQLDDVACLREPGRPWASPLDGRPWVQEAPSIQEPFVFLWDEKVGGTSFMTWLKHSVWKLGKLRKSLMYTTPGHPVAIGTAFFLKTFAPQQRQQLEVVAGQFDWRVMHEGIGCRERKATRCLLLVRDPVDRFISYYLERSDRRFEREIAGNKSLDAWTPAELRRYLAAVARERMTYSGDEPGLFCNSENLLCLDKIRTRASALPLLRHVRPRGAREKLGFRFLGGPQNRLAWVLDPERGDPRLGAWRMRKCVVGLQAEDFDGFRKVLGWHFPWINEVREPAPDCSANASSNYRACSMKIRSRHNPRSDSVKKRLPRFAREMIAEFNWRDMRLYRAARRQFRRQLNRIASASGETTRWPPVDYSSEQEVQDTMSRELQDTVTYQVHEGLNRYMLGL